MKKNLLFVMPSLSAGGGEKSLVNLLSQIDFNLYNVDLFLFDHSGIFMKYIPEEVQIISLPATYRGFSLPLSKAIKKFINNREYSLLYHRIMFTLNNRTRNNVSVKEQNSWRFISPSLNKLDKHYDVAIGFLEKTATYFCVDKVNATKKVGWVHIDYDNLGMNPKFDLEYFQKLNHIVTVSEECATILAKRFPSERKKIEVIYNIVSPDIINKMADQIETKTYDKKASEIVILSVGRLHHQKGFEMAVKACRKLVDKGYNIKWNIIGEGEERGKLTRLIDEYNLEDNFRLLGLKSNPYPYMKEADIYAQPSRFEGKSIAIDEAKILGKPIIVTNFSTAKDQINNGVDGLIVSMDPNAVAEGIEKIINDVELKNRLVKNLSMLELGTEKEINKLYAIF